MCKAPQNQLPNEWSSSGIAWSGDSCLYTILELLMWARRLFTRLRLATTVIDMFTLDTDERIPPICYCIYAGHHRSQTNRPMYQTRRSATTVAFIAGDCYLCCWWRRNPLSATESSASQEQHIWCDCWTMSVALVNVACARCWIPGNTLLELRSQRRG